MLNVDRIGWTQVDSLLSMAFDQYEAERIAPSGYPWRIAGDKERAGDWEVVEDRIDYAMATLDSYQRERRKKDGDGEDGVRPYVRYVPTLRPDQR